MVSLFFRYHAILLFSIIQLSPIPFPTAMLAGLVKFDDFEYVVERIPPQPICFGSKMERDTTPGGKGMSPFQKRDAIEVNYKTGPGHYGIERFNTALGAALNKLRSKKGVGPLASNEPRFVTKTWMRVPSPTRYEVLPKREKKQSPAPFGSKVERVTYRVNNLPGPGTYPSQTRKCRRTRFMYNLGHPKVIPMIETICIPTPLDTCAVCEEVCQGDYWQHEHVTFLCHKCWEEERKTEEYFSKNELKQFKKIRNCSFMHSHEHTTAAIRLLPPRKVNKKLRIENYLDLYLEC